MQNAATDKSKLRVLIVEDNDLSAKTMGWTIELLGHEIKTAYTAEEAVKVLENFIPDIILMDIGLPDVNGYELCKQLKQDVRLEHTVFIAQTGWDDEKHRNLSKEAGFHDHVVKPIDFNILQKIFEERVKQID